MNEADKFSVSQFGEEIRRLLVVAAHPDDMETTSGGTIALLVDKGVEVTLLLCTDGDIGTHDASVPRAELARVRRVEAQAGAKILGVKDVIFLGHPDGELMPDLALRAEVARVYRKVQPDTVFTFDPNWNGQAHPDHTAAGRAAVDAYMPSKMELYHPEQLIDGISTADVKRYFFFGGSNRQGETVIDISAAWDRKLAATRCHVSQFGQKEEALEWLAGWNQKVGECCGLTCAEAFQCMDVW